VGDVWKRNTRQNGEIEINVSSKFILFNTKVIDMSRSVSKLRNKNSTKIIRAVNH
jgi:hypothetical protein